MASLWHVIFLHRQRAPNNNSRGLGLLGTLSEQQWSHDEALSSSSEAGTSGEEPQNTLCRVHKSQGLIFVGSWLPSEGEEWKNEAGLKQIAASGETCGLRLNRAINQRTDTERGRERERETEEDRGKEGDRAKPKVRRQQHNITNV